MSLWKQLLGSTEDALKYRKIRADHEAKNSFLADLKIWQENLRRAEMMEHSDQEILKLTTIISNYVNSVPQTNEYEQRNRVQKTRG